MTSKAKYLLLGSTLLALSGYSVADTPKAASEGSTDIYASNGIAASFWAPATQLVSPLAAANYMGSTDTWGVNGFRASFGPGDPVAQPTNVCRTGSTDIYAVNGFLASFGASPIQAGGDLARACHAPPRS